MKIAGSWLASRENSNVPFAVGDVSHQPILIAAVRVNGDRRYADFVVDVSWTSPGGGGDRITVRMMIMCFVAASLFFIPSSLCA